jgi:hypothetical protein
LRGTIADFPKMKPESRWRNEIQLWSTEKGWRCRIWQHLEENG